ncbi:MAG: hypothetical protein CMB15_04155 [Euryarchaeota archaeon]|mgnify:FL=1|nr:hypothetical protein [Euryarchaeota archaeon]|tara:strand:- start:18665 stop:19288 length:624 start_codon:yes stop_codon:yes gene_type:complete
MPNWRERLEEYDDEHRHMLEGGSISQLFLNYSLSISSPVFVGIVYAIIINLTLLLPMFYDGNSNSESSIDILEKWGFQSLIIILLCASLGAISTVISSLIKIPPVRLERRRRYLYPLPFVGFFITTITIIFSTPEELQILGYFILISPGPIYIQISYAPRWRMIERIDRDLNPFEGMKKTIYLEKENPELSEQNFNELENAIEELDS